MLKPMLWKNGRLMIGKIAVGYVNYNGTRAMGDKSNEFKGCCDLPCLKNDIVYCNTAEEVQQKIEHKVNEWMKEIME